MIRHREKSSLTALLILIPILSGYTETSGSQLDHAVELFETQQYVAARGALQDIYDEENPDGKTAYYLGRLALIDNDREAAVRYLEIAADLEPDRSEYHQWLATAIMRKMPYVGFFGKIRSGPKMMKELERAIEIDSTNVDARMMLFSIMVHSYGKAPVSRDAVISMSQHIAAIDTVMGHVAGAMIHHHIDEDLAEADTEYQAALGRISDKPSVIRFYASFLNQTGQHLKAAELLGVYLEEEPGDPDALFSLGVTLVLAGQDLEHAREHFQRCLALPSADGMPSKSMVHWSLGVTYHLMGRDDKAHGQWAVAEGLDKDIEKILKASPELRLMQATITED
jgi:tetratricopeptide (TPR) repeat protein